MSNTDPFGLCSEDSGAINLADDMPDYNDSYDPLDGGNSLSGQAENEALEQAEAELSQQEAQQQIEQNIDNSSGMPDTPLCQQIEQNAQAGSQSLDQSVNAVSAAPELDLTPIETTTPSTNITEKIQGQMANRGWTEDSINNTIDNPYTTREASNKATGNSTTAYYNEDGSCVVKDDVTGDVVQISKVGDTAWIPDSTIVNPYQP